MTNHDIIIKAKIFKSHREFIDKRTKRIEEAIAFKGGTIKKQKKHLKPIRITLNNET